MIALAVAWAIAASQPTIADASWLTGRWAGTGLGGQVEEIWSPASGGQMVGHFQLIKDGAPVFYEILLLDATADGLRMRVKHFNRDFTAWEDKSQWVTFQPESVSPNSIKFKGLTADHSGGRLTMKLMLRGKDGKVREEVFEFRRDPQ